MESNDGKHLCREEKVLLVRLKQYFDRNRSEFKTKETSVQMVADALGFGLATVNRILASYNKDSESINSISHIRGRPTYALDTSLQTVVRSYIREANLCGEQITLEAIADFLKDKHADDKCHKSTLARTLDRWGFEFGKGIRTQHLKEKDYVIAARQRYLRKMKNNRIEYPNDSICRPEVYLDESYVNKNHSNDFTWYLTDDGPWLQKPTGNGDRLVIVNAITKDGWVPGAGLVFKSSRKTGDYHGQMNSDLFYKWFTEKLIPNIPANSLIVMDNAVYHNVLSEYSAPTISSSKIRILKWLEHNKIACSADCLRAELIEIISKIAPEPTYVIDEIAKAHGHEVLRTPPYHPELQPIETCWGVLKNEIARHCDFTMKNLETQLEEGFKKVTGQTCRKIIKRVRSIEDKFWKDDAKMEKMLKN